MEKTFSAPSPKVFGDIDVALRHAAQIVREAGEAINATHVKFVVEISGRPTGPLKLEFKLAYNYDSDVVGADLQSVLSEALRRRGWNAANAPLAISYAGDLSASEEDDGIPF